MSSDPLVCLQYRRGHHKNEIGLRLMCSSLGIVLRQSDSRASTQENTYDFLWSPVEWIDSLPQRVRGVVFGPHFFVFPEGQAGGLGSPATERDAETFFGKGRWAFYNVLADWNFKLHNLFCPSPRVAYKCLPFAVDCDRWAPGPGEPLSNGFLVYFKGREPTLPKATSNGTRSPQDTSHIGTDVASNFKCPCVP